ncbi:UDP-N-acetylmuramoyl-tripeptide--D-alanyl-D-alanine ligase [Colwellia sp. D2M02]|uniref:UDP-N-acetylmuramoyl-tripeptide--D-alanyl-D- alanine ligase n=1 Tax=Colwellia sp. D2M02 TaxID=2841562 RepID=UPI001C0A1F0A|nr:UDP-N-acetylmuramoyl-tripeptide--D-alanyl-D-alanine ligase [Colwellia sp. D2M02]MBU2894841.1 UDP-N-acetylmuramoyl-tripeptide--D-alanyl-D-alanine ligase [Colwellia sp. D2M02]
MITLTLSALKAATDGQVVASKELKDLSVEDLVIDSREISSDASSTAFLALKGPNFDGHRFIEQVVNKGCRVVIVEHEITDLDCPGFDSSVIAQLIVNDTRIALGQIAAYVKAQVAPKTVGITGSSGKTTVKEMTGAILSRLGNVLVTNGNFNNDIGVPLTLLRLNHSHDFAVIEMGANHMGEIAYTTALAKPDVAVINNIAAAHLEGFGDLCGVARAKGEIFSGLGTNGVALYNKDTKYTNKWQWRLTDKNVATFSCAGEADCYSSNVQLDQQGCASFQLHTRLGQCQIDLPIPGKHNVCNAVAAASIALEFGASLDDVYQGLALMKAVKGRLNLHQLTDKRSGCRVKLIDDSYNANLESAKAAALLLSSYNGQQIFILGDMGELGADARSYHEEVGYYAKELGIDQLFSLGVLSQSASDVFSKKELEQQSAEQGQHFSQRLELMNRLCKQIEQYLAQGQQDIAILVKGSRSAKMELVVADIMNWFNEGSSDNTRDGTRYSCKQNEEGVS